MKFGVSREKTTLNKTSFILYLTSGQKKYEDEYKETGKTPIPQWTWYDYICE